MQLIERPVLQRILSRLPKNRILILIGARQTGKTSLLRLLEEKIKEGHPESTLLFFDCEKLEHREQFASYPQTIGFLKGQVGNLEKSLILFLDEFQKIPDIGTTLKLLADHHPTLQVIASGSSSIEIKRNLKESMVGRKRIFEIQPLTFGEYLVFTEHPQSGAYAQYLANPSWDLYALYYQSWLEHCLYGGFPRIALETVLDEKKNELNEIYTSYLEKDIRSYLKEEKLLSFNKLLKVVASQIGHLVNIGELANTTGLKRQEVEEFLFILEQTFILFFLPPFHTNLRKELTKMRKVYFYDVGLRNMILKNFTPLDERPDGGALFENAIIAEILKQKRLTDQLYFWQTQQRAEVDLVIKKEEKILPVEIKLNLSSLGKLRGLRSFCQHYKLHGGIVVTKEKPPRTGKDLRSLPPSFVSNLFHNL